MKIFKPILTILSVLLLAAVVTQGIPAAMFLYLMATSEPGDELLLTSTSPGGTYTLEAHRINPGATEPFYIWVYRVDGDREERIYAVRGEDKVEIEWQTEHVARINGVPLDLSKDETFEADAGQYFQVAVVIGAEDVYSLGMTIHYNGEARATEAYSYAKGGPLDVDARVKTRVTALRELRHDDELHKGRIGITVSVGTENGEIIELPYIWEWRAEFYEAYTFTLTGSAAWGYTLTAEGMQCAVTPLEE